MFKGAGDMGARDIVERIEAEGGSINAATGYERTSFEVRALDGSLGLAMQVVSDLVFRPTLDPAEIEREKDVVAQEIAEAFDTPDDHVFEMAQTRGLRRPAAGPADPGLGRQPEAGRRGRPSATGARGSIRPTGWSWRCPGAVDEAELLALAERWFGDAAADARRCAGAAALHRRRRRR